MHFEIERQWNHCPVEIHGTYIFTYRGTYQITMEKIHGKSTICRTYIYILYIYLYIYIYESMKMRNSSALRLDGLRWLKEVVSGLFFLCVKKRHAGYQLVYTLTGQYIKIILFKWIIIHSVSILYSVMFGVPWGYQAAKLVHGS